MPLTSELMVECDENHLQDQRMNVAHQKHNQSKHASRLHGNSLDSVDAKALCIASREDWDLPAANSTLLTSYGFKLSTDLHLHHCSRSWASYSLESNEDRESTHEKKAILWAAAKGESQTMAFLLAQTPSDLSFRNCYGQTALSLAAEHGRRDTMQLILARANVNVNDWDIDGQTPLAWAAFHGHFDLVEMLLDRDDLNANTKDVDGNTPLAWAAANGHYAIAEQLLERFDVEICPVNFWGETPQDLANGNGHNRIVRLLRMWSS
ncbi:ankyrin repeat-containing domain protein [Exophiala viscosa]|uniref:ankyrin repeat-containing domain protein n=1 Tax=Exophiala viscosa TaxID=2486360 RepID=UPI00219B003E|nr:ankyrin repeat-containing domain protein [Exophiala viscosa]